jgi:hypothetical protein
MGKHFPLTLTGEGFHEQRNPSSIAAALDGVCVLRTSVPPATWDPASVVRAYKAW